jgi:hypothetical protein
MLELELELELMQPHMTQKPMLRGEVGARALRIAPGIDPELRRLQWAKGHRSRSDKGRHRTRVHGSAGCS